MADKVNFVDEYRTIGYCVVKNVFSMKEVSAIRSEATLALTKASELKESGYRHSPLDIRKNSAGNLYPAISVWPSLVSNYLEKVRIDPRLVEIVKAVLGDDVKQLNNQFYFHLAGEEDSFNWHQDIMFRHPLDEYPRIVEEDNYLQTAIIVDSFTKDVSPLYMVPKSYLLGDLQLLKGTDGTPDYKSLRSLPDMEMPSRNYGLEPQVLEAEPGDVAIWCSLTLHASMPGSNDGFRAYYMNGFAAARNARGWPEYLRKGRVVNLNTKLIP
jgi:ectoine hydroxylase-related dioxygenase (phytanoyl-CoA dioxygenase family)